MINNIDEILEKEFKVLDHGFVRLLDYMGSDDAIVEAARVSYGKGTKRAQDDRGLIRYLMRHRHTTPFEMVEFKFHVKLPIFVARQWIRHRTANVNEYSGRYSVMEDEFYVPTPEAMRYQSQTNRQGRDDEQEVPRDVSESFIKVLNSMNENSYKEYRTMIDSGIAREIARINLPLSLYTQWYWKIDLHNLFHFLKLRLHPTAQAEIRLYAKIMADMVQRVVPVAYEAFADYQLDAVTLSRPEQKVVAELFRSQGPGDDEMKAAGLSKREIAEFKDKLARITGGDKQ